MDSWAPGSECATIDPFTPDSSVTQCMPLTDIMARGGFEYCDEQMMGCTILHEISGPYDSEAECIAAGCGA
jgi:hypothetical protein